MRQKDREKEKKGRGGGREEEKWKKRRKKEGRGIHFCLRARSSYLSERTERGRLTTPLPWSRHRSWCVWPSDWHADCPTSYVSLWRTTLHSLFYISHLGSWVPVPCPWMPCRGKWRANTQVWISETPPRKARLVLSLLTAEPCLMFWEPKRLGI